MNSALKLEALTPQSLEEKKALCGRTFQSRWFKFKLKLLLRHDFVVADVAKQRELRASVNQILDESPQGFIVQLFECLYPELPAE